MAENVNPKAGPGSGLAIAIIGVVIVLVLVFYFWMGAWRGTGGAMDPESGPPPEVEQPIAPQPVTP